MLARVAKNTVKSSITVSSRFPGQRTLLRYIRSLRQLLTEWSIGKLDCKVIRQVTGSAHLIE